MLIFHRLYKSANPDHTDEVTNLAVKKKFMNGISPAIRQKIFIFCNDPFANAVTRDALLGHCRKTKNLNPQTNQTADYSTERVLVASDHVPENSGVNENQILTAFQDKTRQDFFSL